MRVCLCACVLALSMDACVSCSSLWQSVQAVLAHHRLLSSHTDWPSSTAFHCGLTEIHTNKPVSFTSKSKSIQQNSTVWQYVCVCVCMWTELVRGLLLGGLWQSQHLEGCHQPPTGAFTGHCQVTEGERHRGMLSSGASPTSPVPRDQEFIFSIQNTQTKPCGMTYISYKSYTFNTNDKYVIGNSTLQMVGLQCVGWWWEDLLREVVFS